VSGSIWNRGGPPGGGAGEPEQAAASSEPLAPPPVTGDFGWLTADFDPSQQPDLPAVEVPPLSAPPVSAPAPAPDLTAVAPPQVELPAVAPPAPAAAASPAAAPEPTVPFWKKEISLGRKPKQPRQPKPPRQRKQPKQAQPAVQGPPTPFWKKELSFGRRKPAGSDPGLTPPQAPTVELPAVEAPKQPFWKKELSLGRRPPRGAAGSAKPKRARPAAPPRAPKGKSTIVGLKIGASQVAAARVANGETPQLVQVARQPLPDGVVVAGELREVETLAQTLKELFAKHKLPRRNVRLGIANNRIGVRTFEIAGIDDERQLANAIRFRAHETLPIPLEEAVLDWRVLNESVDPETGQPVRRVLLVVAYRDLVDRYVAACKKAGLRLVGIDLEAFAMLRALNAPRPNDGTPAAGAQVAVNVGHDRSTFAVSDGRACEFTRVLNWGGQNLSVAIARALDLTPSEADPIKHALSLVATYAPPEGVSVEAMNTAREAVVRELQSFARELVSSLRFYQSQPGSLGIGEIVMTGGTAHLPGFADELQRLIGVPVRVGDPLNRVVLPKKFREPDGCGVGSFTVAIGLGIDD